MTVEAPSLTEDARRKDMRAFRRVMTALAVVTVAAGGVVAFAPLGLDEDRARTVASVLFLVGICDTLILMFWARLFRSQSGP